MQTESLESAQLSLVKLTANRSNAQMSTGPKSPEGRRRSSLNAYRHGLTGQIVIRTAEESAAFEKHCADYIASLAPIGHQEQLLARACAENLWRLNRARAIEDAAYAEGLRRHYNTFDCGNEQVNAAVAQADTWKTEAPNFQLLTLYENRIRRALEKDKAEFKSLQETRKAAFEQSRTEAMLLTELAESKDEIYDPEPDFPLVSGAPSGPGGFVYSAPEIKRLISRQARLDEAIARKKALRFPAPQPQKAA